MTSTKRYKSFTKKIKFSFIYWTTACNWGALLKSVSRWDSHCSEMLCCIDWLLITDIQTAYQSHLQGSGNLSRSSWTLEMRPIGCPEVSPSYQSTLHNIPVEWRSHFHCSGSQKLHTVSRCTDQYSTAVLHILCVWY